MATLAKSAFCALYKYSGAMHAQERVAYWSGRRQMTVVLFHRVTDAIPITLHAPKSSAATIARRFFDEVEKRIEKLVSISDGSRKAGVSRNAEPALRT